jgi:hypothetical protein
MSTDRELLELAAKAAGIDVGPDDFTDPIGRKYTEGLGLWVRPSYGNWWSPLTDDGDALRLAVKLAMDMDTNGSSTFCRADRAYKGAHEPHDGDSYAATRRAIVRAAAEIGKAKP